MDRQREVECEVRPKVIVIEGDTGGGPRKFTVRLDESDEILFRADYEMCGWSFVELLPQIIRLAEALGAEVDDQT